VSKTQRTLPNKAGPGVKDERWIKLWFQEALAWRSLRLPAKFPNSNSPKPRVPETPSYYSGRASERPVEAFKMRCPGEAQRQDRKQRRGHRQRRQQTSPAVRGAQERRGRQALG